MTTTTDSFGQRLRRLRLRRALTQQELADRAGLSRTAVLHIEQDQQIARPRTIRALARALGVKPSDLLAD